MLSKKYRTRLHILHISTKNELALFDNSIPLEEKRITAEVCVHHLYFDDNDYGELGTKIKWNPAIKNGRHKPELLKGLLDNKLDIIATDHAPHTIEEKNQPYTKCPSGAPMVQHSLSVMLDFYFNHQITLEKIVEKMSHSPAICFRIKDRGFIRESYYADMFLLDLNSSYTVSKDTLLYKCGWSPLEGKTFKGVVTDTFVSGHHAYRNRIFNEQNMGNRLQFNSFI